MQATKVRGIKIKQSKKDTAFDIVNYIFMAVLVLLIVFPLMNLFSFAFSDGAYNPKVYFLPQGLTLNAFKYVIAEQAFIKSLINSVIITATVTILSNILMPLAAYPLSKKDCPFRKFFMIFFVITMLFSPGIIPAYILLKMLHLTDTIWSVISISILNVFNLLLYKTFFEGLPEEIEEAARIDGASSLKMFFYIVLPMSLPVLASCCFFVLVGCWNSYSGALIFITVPDSYPLALYIFKLLETTDKSKEDVWKVLNAVNIRSATIVISIIPIIAVYPYVVKHIKSGLSVGSVKG